MVVHDAKTILGYTGLKQLTLTVSCKNHSLQDDNGLEFLCHAVQEASSSKGEPFSPKVHIELLRDVPGKNTKKNQIDYWYHWTNPWSWVRMKLK